MSQVTPLLSAEKRPILTQRFQECIHTFPFTIAGERQIHVYRSERQIAQAKYTAIVTAYQRGDDSTDDVLDHLLPHANTTANRDKGLWITHTATMPQDIRAWYTRTGWAKAEDWPNVSRAILHFIDQCLTDPTRLEDACREFTLLPYTKGLQMGMLTPILNALQPETFLLVNRPTLRVLNFFTDAHFTMRLSDYPAINAYAQQFINEIADLMHYPLTPALADADLFDLFAHWLVIVKRADLTGVRAWKIAITAIDADWYSCLQNGYLGLPHVGIDNISQMSHDEFKAQIALLQQGDATDHDDLKQWWTFAHAIQEDDQIIVNHGKRLVVAVGRITGPYYYVAGEHLPHRLPIEWMSKEQLKVYHPGWRKTVSRIDRQTYESVIHQLEPMIDQHSEADAMNDTVPFADSTVITSDTIAIHEEGNGYQVASQLPEPEIDQHGIIPIYIHDPQEAGETRLARVTSETNIDAAQLVHWQQLIDHKGQAIISGPPGTGKSYLAERLAQLLADGPGSFVEMVQFHPAYAY